MLPQIIRMLESLPPALLAELVKLLTTVLSAPPSKRARALRDAQIAAKVHAFDAAMKKAGKR